MSNHLSKIKRERRGVPGWVRELSLTAAVVIGALALSYLIVALGATHG